MTMKSEPGRERSGYAPVNGLDMYYEIHGTGQPLVLLHGAFSAIGTSFQHVLPDLAKTRQVIAFEMQAHGRTPDIDRPLSQEQMADDTVAALQYLGVERADIFGYSTGAGVSLHVAIRHPEVVRKLVLASVAYDLSGVHPGLMEGLADMTPDMMFGSPWHEEYIRIAPRPEDFATLFEKKTQMDRGIQDLPAETIRAIEAPTLLIIGDSDLVRPEHAVEMFRLLGEASSATRRQACRTHSSPSSPAPLTCRLWTARTCCSPSSRDSSTRLCRRTLATQAPERCRVPACRRRRWRAG